MIILSCPRIAGERHRPDPGAGGGHNCVDAAAHHGRTVHADHVPGARGPVESQLQATTGVQLGLLADVGQRVQLRHVHHVLVAVRHRHGAGHRPETIGSDVLQPGVAGPQQVVLQQPGLLRR